MDELREYFIHVHVHVHVVIQKRLEGPSLYPQTYGIYMY